jgi:hypothetical protein
MQKFEVFTKAFDKAHGTNLWEAGVREGVLKL